MLRHCVLALLLCAFAPFPLRADEAPIKLALEVQAALQQGRRFLTEGEFSSAVKVLEASANQAQGDAIYLKLLETSYRGYVKQLQLQGRTDLVKEYQSRLAVLQKALPPPILPSPSEAAPKKQEPIKLAVSKEKPAPAKKGVVVRGQQADEATVAVETGKLLGRADEAFLAEKYTDAGQLYQSAYGMQRELPAITRERWAYCKLHKVTQQLNQPSDASLDLVGLEQEVKEALTLAPRFDFGQKLLEQIAKRTGKPDVPTTPATPAPATAVQHLPAQGSWQIAESQHFRCHHQNKALAEQALGIAERTREAVCAKWLGGSFPNPWTSKCDLHLFPTGQMYAQSTGAPPESPGHSSINASPQDATQVQHRRVDLRCDHAHLLVAVLPHEVTHAVLAGQVGHRPIPRWADEGLAVLSETYERIGRHLQPLPQTYMEGRAFSVEQLVNMEDYPEPSRMGCLYGQGVCLVQYLTDQKGPAEFIAFLRTSDQLGYEAALTRHYGFGLAELDKRLEKYIVHERVPSLTAASR